MVPVNLRPLEHAWQLGNRFGLVPLVLPVGIANPVERLYEVRRRMHGLKGSTQPLLVYGVLSVAGALAKPVQDLLLALFHRKTTAEEILRTVNPGLRESALALGAPQWRVVAQVVVPTARAGLVTAARDLGMIK